MEIKIKRVYEQPEKNDGYRILVDRIWPRGVSKEEAAIDWWDKDIAPSTKLREWFGHVPERFEEFKEEYIHELDANAESVKEVLDALEKHPLITLVYAAKDTEHNHALVLKEYLEEEALRS